MKLKTNLKHSVEVGAFRFNFYLDENKLRKGSVDGTYLKISAIGRENQWSLTIPGNAHVFGYLLEALNQGKNDQLHGYAFILNAASMLLTQDEGFNADIQRAIMEWQKRMDKKAETAAKSVSEAEEMASQSLMEDIISEQGLSKRELKAKREADKEAMREVLNEDMEENKDNPFYEKPEEMDANLTKGRVMQENDRYRLDIYPINENVRRYALYEKKPNGQLKLVERYNDPDNACYGFDHYTENK